VRASHPDAKLRQIFSFPVSFFYWSDMALVMGIYVLAAVLFLKRKREHITPLLVFGLFLFPIQFGIWFLSSNAKIAFFADINILKVIYLFFLKLCVLLTIALSRR